MTSMYERNSATGVWGRKDAAADFWYSDGGVEENCLLEVIQSATNLSTHSPELAAAVNSWPSTYHLSPLRSNLLRGFDFPPASRVLEIGCGCGAITRYLGERGLDVTAVEGSPVRARIAASRCRDLENVKVFCDRWENFSGSGEFDFVLLIGVLEYAGVDSGSGSPYADCLRLCRNRLTSRGAVLIAIENRLGLKYFAGHLEDHVAEAYWGIEGRESRGTPQTFGKTELVRLLQEAELLHCKFFYPFPDYKLPQIILSEAAFSDKDLNVSDLLLRNQSRTYNAMPSLGFDEQLARFSLEKNKILAEFANSFLVCAAPAETSLLAPTWLAEQFQFRNREGRSTVSSFYRVDGGLKVHKTPDPASALESPDSDANGAFQHVTGENDYVPGVMLVRILRLILARGGGIADVSRWAEPWVKFLTDRILPDSSGMLPGSLVDGVPFNFIVDKDGTLHAIDQEWQSKAPIPFAWVVVRGLAYSLAASPRKGECGDRTYRALVLEIAAELKISLSESDIADSLRWEAELQRYALGASPAGIQSPLESILESEVTDDSSFAREQLAAAQNAATRAAHGEEIALQRESEAREFEKLACLREAAAEKREAEAREFERQALARAAYYETCLGSTSEELERERAARTRLEGVLKKVLARRGRGTRLVEKWRQKSAAFESRNRILGQTLDDAQHQFNALNLLHAEKERLLGVAQSGARESDSHRRLFHRRKSSSSQPPDSITTGNGEHWPASLLSYIRLSLFDENFYRSQFTRPPALDADLFRHFLLRGWREGKRPHRLFHTNFYLRQKPDLIVQDYNPLLHFVRHGVGERRNPHPLFDVHYYLTTYRDILMEEENPLEHFLCYGRRRRLNPCSYFDTDYYLNQRPDLDRSGVNPLVHYIEHGWREGTEPCPLFSGEYFLRTSRIELLPGDTPLGTYVQSLTRTLGGAGNPHPLFNTQYYYSQFSRDEFSREPLLHFLRLSPEDNRSPCPLFDTKYYRETNTDVSFKFIHPFLHYVLRGFREYRQPHPLFDVAHYHRSLLAAGVTPLENLLTHYFTIPVSQRFSPHVHFDWEWYRKRYASVLRTGEDPLLHYLLTGQFNGATPNPRFQPKYYIERYADARQSDLLPFMHFLRYGLAEQRECAPG